MCRLKKLRKHHIMGCLREMRVLTVENVVGVTVLTVRNAPGITAKYGSLTWIHGVGVW